MDIFCHATTGLLLSTAFDEPAAKAACIIGSVLPDTALAPVYTHIYQKKQQGDRRTFWQLLVAPLPERILRPYRIMHSLVPASLLAGAGYLFAMPVLLGLAVGCFSHILWDIPTHTQNFACRPFYPLSTKKWEGWGDWWVGRKGKVIMASVWLILLSVFFVVR